MILTEIGEVGVHVDGRVHVLRPSLYAMSQLGEPSEIVEVYASLMADQVSPVGRREQFRNALAVVHACSEDDLSDVFGYLNERLKYVVKRADPRHILTLARSLITHGVTGALPPLPRPADQGPEYVAEFVPREHVAIAVAHLGVSEREAWGMTMTSLVGALRSKYPPKVEGANAPTPEEHEATMEWYERVAQKRKQRKG